MNFVVELFVILTMLLGIAGCVAQLTKAVIRWKLDVEQSPLQEISYQEACKICHELIGYKVGALVFDIHSARTMFNEVVDPFVYTIIDIKFWKLHFDGGIEVEIELFGLMSGMILKSRGKSGRLAFDFQLFQPEQ